MVLPQRKRKRKNQNEHETEYLLTPDSPFAVQEAYKTLRTNLIFSLPGSKCKVIIVTSSVPGEAKSTTAVNLGIAFAQNKSRVILVDCDLRRPTTAKKLGVKSKPGLSNILVGMENPEFAVQRLENGLDIIPSGDIPPNPTELLGSANMKMLLSALEEYYDYVILDTPPVCTVADATILAKNESGVLIVVRQDYSRRELVSEALRKLEFAEANVLGFIFTDVKNEKQSYYKRRDYRYGYGYGNEYTSKLYTTSE